jgi:hypothetical protein
MTTIVADIKALIGPSGEADFASLEKCENPSVTARHDALSSPKFSKVSNIDRAVWIAAQHIGSITAPSSAIFGD